MREVEVVGAVAEEARVFAAVAFVVGALLEVGVEFGFEPFEVRVDEGVEGVGELRGREEGVGEGGLEGAPQGQVFGEEGVQFGAGLADAGLEVEDGDAGFAGGREPGAGEEADGQGVGLRVVRGDEGEKGGFARACKGL